MNSLITPFSYEALVEDVCRQLVGNIDAKVHHKSLFKGASGHNHEIDVAVDFEVKGLRLLVLIECKWWKKRVGVQEVMVLLQRLQDIGAHKGVIVSSVGFQKGAIKMAEMRGVALVIFDGNVGTLTFLEHCYSGQVDIQEDNVEEADTGSPIFLYSGHGDVEKVRVQNVEPRIGCLSSYSLVTSQEGGRQRVSLAQLIDSYSSH